METEIWLPEPRGAGPAAAHRIVDAGDEMVELLAYDIPPDSLGPRLCGFEIFGRRRPGGDFDQQRASGLADTLEDAAALVLTTVKQSTDTSTLLPAGEPT